jgi:hypothetical protein
MNGHHSNGNENVLQCAHYRVWLSASNRSRFLATVKFVEELDRRASEASPTVAAGLKIEHAWQTLLWTRLRI